MQCTKLCPCNLVFFRATTAISVTTSRANAPGMTGTATGPPRKT